MKGLGGRPCVEVFGKGIIFLTWPREVQTHGTSRKYCTKSRRDQEKNILVGMMISGDLCVELKVI